MRIPSGYDWRLGRLNVQVITARNVTTWWHYNNRLGPRSLELGRLIVWWSDDE